MMHEFIFWTYVANATVLLNHQIDSAFWQEWKLFNPDDKNGINGFLLIHFPLLFFIILGAVLVRDASLWGYLISTILSFSGIFAFFFHFYHIRSGREEFNTSLSKFILIAGLIFSVVLAGEIFFVTLN